MRESTLESCARFLAALTGWRRHAAATLFGALAAGALPPAYLLPLLLPAFCGLFWLLDSVTRPRQAAFLGWSFGFGHGVVGLYWVGHAFLVDVEQFGFLMPFAVAGLAALLAVFPALALLAVALCGWNGIARVLSLTLFWVLSEWLRSWILTGFPWNLLGSIWAFSDQTLQLAAVSGVWGLSAMTLLAAAAPAALAGQSGRPAGAQRLTRIAVVVFLLLPALNWGGGFLRLAAAPDPGENMVEGVTLRLVQPNIEQTLKWQRDLRLRHVERLIELSRASGFDGVTHVIWPETAVPFLLSSDEPLRRLVSAAVPEQGLLLTGAPRRGPAQGGSAQGGSVERPGRGGALSWNSLHALDASGAVRATYDKFHLVPFGEYVPQRSLLSFSKLTAGRGDFSSGPGVTTLALPGLPPVSPLICYEIIFPGAVVDRDDRPGWILNVTNDAWFGDSSGPRQHFSAARMRAVEEGVPVIRVANTGISGVIDGYGRVLGSMALGTGGVLDSGLPKPAGQLAVQRVPEHWRLSALLVLLLAIGLWMRRFS